LIVTNYHVVEHADKITIKLADRRELYAAVIGHDARGDIALLKVAAPDVLKAAPLGDSSRLQTGEWVLAMGSPFGLDRTVTAGIVSANARRIPPSVYYDFIQTDVSINPGNSGGPLLNLQGRVVGINTAMLSRNGANVGINFAIPINLIKDLLPDLLTKGRVTRGWLGISTQAISPAVARLLNVEPTAGALVVAVHPAGPATHAGIRAGDVIVEYNGRSVIDASELPSLVAKTAVGRQVAVRITRGRLLYRVIVAVDELKEPAHRSTKTAGAPPNFDRQPKLNAGETRSIFSMNEVVDRGVRSQPIPDASIFF
jgi:serine protease Do